MKTSSTSERLATPIMPKSSLSTTQASEKLIRISEFLVSPGQWDVPASPEVSIALTLSNTSAVLGQTRNDSMQNIPAGNTTICRLNEARIFELATSSEFAILSLKAEAFVPALQDSPLNSVELPPHDILEDATLRQIATVLLEEKRNHFQNGLLFLDTMITALSVYLLNRYSAALPSARLHKGGLARAALRNCTEFIDAQFSGQIRLEDLAREAGVSPSHLIRSFRQSTGKTPYQFVLSRRIEHAKRLMTDARLSLTEVALACGFANQHHLSRVFTDIVGLTPSRYRRERIC